MSLYPRKRTCGGRVGMSAKCQKQTCARLFDQLVGSQHEAGGNFVANGFGGLDVDHQFKGGGPFDRNLRWSCAAQHAGNQSSALAEDSDKARTITNHAAFLRRSGHW